MGGIGMSVAGAGGLISGAVGLGIFLIVLLIIIAVSCINIVPQAHAYVVERLGTYRGTWSVGFHVKMPFFDKIAKRVTLKEQVVDFAPQPVITKDNVTMRIDTVVFFQITDPKHLSTERCLVWWSRWPQHLQFWQQALSHRHCRIC